MMAASTPSFFRRGDGDFRSDFRLLADLDQRVMLADVAVLLHVAAGLAQKPHRRPVDRLAQAGTHKAGALQQRVLEIVRTSGVLVSNVHIG